MPCWGSGTWGLAGTRARPSSGPALHRAPAGKNSRQLPGAPGRCGGPSVPLPEPGLPSSLTLERVSQAQVPGPMVTVATGPACPGPLLSLPQAPQQVLGMPVNMLMWGRARVCLWTCVSANTLPERAHICACEVTASAFLSSHPTLVSTWCLLFPQIDVPMLAPCPKVPAQFRGIKDQSVCFSQGPGY